LAGTDHTGPQIQAAARSDRNPAYLVVECRPDAADSDLYLISAWLQHGKDPGITLWCEDEPRRLNTLPALLKELLFSNQTVVNRYNPELILEFVIPRALLQFPFDQFRITVDGLERRIGIDHPVVVRSLDRMRHQALHHNWRRKWEWLQANPAAAAVCWVSHPRQFDQELLYVKLCESSSAVLAMAFPPWGKASCPVDELSVALQAGTPIIAWCRQGRDPARFAAETRALLASDVLFLPRRVLDLRREAVSAGPADDHLGLHLALLFDDADRIPEPYIRLEPPA
jgi:hypothetical protein